MAKRDTLRWMFPWDTNPASLRDTPEPKRLDPITPYLPIAETPEEKRSTRGSASYSAEELRQGYRRLG